MVVPKPKDSVLPGPTSSGSNSQVERPLQPFGWHGLCGLLPSEWEPLAYSIKAEGGRIEFHTRRGLASVYHWKTVTQVPDLQRTVASLLEGGSSPGAIHISQVICTPEWHVWRAEQTASIGCARYFPQLRLLAVWVIAPDTPAEDWLTVIAKAEPNVGGFRRWCLFGIDASLPSDYQITRVRAFPANVRLEFSKGKGRHLLSIQRWGLPEDVLGGRSLEAFARRILFSTHHRPLRAIPTDPKTGGVRVAFRPHRSNPFMGWIGRGRQGEIEIRLEQNGHRLLLLEQQIPAGAPCFSYDEILPCAFS